MRFIRSVSEMRKPCKTCAKRRAALKLAAQKLIIKIKPKGKEK